VKRPIIWYGVDLEEDVADYIAKSVELSAGGTQFDLYFKGEKVSRFKTNLMGLHNISNTLAAISISHEAGLSWEIIQKGLLSFQGVGRRLEKLFEKDKFVVIDDYGHHPTEVKATISTLRKVDSRKLCVVFEPHRFSRTQNFWKEFQESFEGSDELFITPIYAASEKPIDGITSERMVQEMKAKGKNVTYLSSLDEMKALLSQRKDGSCVFVTLGAGAISKKIREMVKSL